MPTFRPIFRPHWLRVALLYVSLYCASLYCALYCGPSLAAEPPTAKPLTAEGLQADVDLLAAAYKRLHPGLYRYNTPEQIDGHLADLRAALRGEPDLGRSFLAFSQFAAKIRCGHTYPNFYNQSEAVADALFHDSNKVPFEFRWLGERMILTRNLSTDPSLVPGTEILEIEGVPVATVLARLMTIARADGGNDAKRRRLLEVDGSARYMAFDLYLPLFFPQVDETHTLRVRAPGAKATRTIEVPALSDAQRQAAQVSGNTRSDDPVFALRFLDHGVAVLEMPSWALYNSRWDWRGFLRQTFETLDARGTPALILDLRRNEGGLDVGDAILAHLSDRPRSTPRARRLVRYRSTPEALRPYLDTWDRSFHDWGAAARDSEQPGFFRLVRAGESADVDSIAPATPHYRGQVYALIGAANSSATFEFARALRDSGLGTLVGQTTGGNLRGINGGGFFFLRLPHSGIELDLPLIGQFPVDPQPDAGLAPDIAVEATVEDIARGRDPELDAALADLAARPH